jgi:hypothetical protein
LLVEAPFLPINQLTFQGYDFERRGSLCHNNVNRNLDWYLPAMLAPASSMLSEFIDLILNKDWIKDRLLSVDELISLCGVFTIFREPERMSVDRMVDGWVL